MGPLIRCVSVDPPPPLPSPPRPPLPVPSSTLFYPYHAPIQQHTCPGISWGLCVVFGSKWKLPAHSKGEEKKKKRIVIIIN
jgi:hypothetical protein